MNWIKINDTEIKGIVPIRTSHGDGQYHIYLVKRPHYCDRGDWNILVESEGASDLDWADGFPRYFFGSEEDAKRQMETWVSRRKECK